MVVVDAAHGGQGWTPRVEGRSANQATYYVAHDGDDLNSVLLHLPDYCFKSVVNPLDFDWVETVDIARAREELLELADVYRARDVSVHFFEPKRPMANHMFMRDLFTMTPNGALVSRMASMKRAGEETELAEALLKLAIPIVRSVGGPGVFEGPDLVFFDYGHAFVGQGVRSNVAGTQQVIQELALQGVEATPIQTTFGCGHLDGVLSILNRRTAVLFPRRVSYVVYEKLRKHGYEIIVVEDEVEADLAMSINVVCVNQETIIMNERATSLRKQIEAVGIEVISVGLDEVMKGGGAMHCASGIIGRTR